MIRGLGSIERVTDEHFRLLDLMPVGAFAVDEDFSIVFWNILMEEWTGLGRNEMTGSDLISRFKNLEEPRYRRRIESLFTDSMPIVFSVSLHKYIIPILRPGGGLRSQNTSVIPVTLAAGGKLALFIIQDVTDLADRVAAYREMSDKALREVAERKQAEQELIISKEEAESANNSKSIFLSSMSHEIRTPLPTIPSRTLKRSICPK